MERDMKNKVLSSPIVITFCMFVLGACAGRENPVALQPINADSEITQLPALEKARAAGPVTLYAAIVAQGVPSQVAKVAFEKYDQFSSRVRNPAYITMIDFTQHSREKRLYMVNRATGKVEQWTVAHGEGSDPDDNGYPQFFSNVPDSHMSSLGAYLIQEKYQGKYGDSLKLDGLEATNSNARDRDVVLHPSSYVKDGSSKQGRSWGCPAIPWNWIQTVIARSQNGGFMYAYGINRRSAATEIRALRSWDLIPKAQWPSEGEGAPELGE
jgi:hypothetical protein